MDGVPTLETQIDASDVLLRDLLSLAQLLRHDGSIHQIHALSLYASILELFSGCTVLARSREAMGIAVLLRPMYEAMVDLDNLLRDHTYVEHLEAANLKQILRLLSAAKRGNPLTEGFRDDSPETSLALAARFEELKARGILPLRIDERCRRVNRLHEYESLYALFCIDSHNNSAALAERHISDQPSGVPLVSFFGAPNLGFAVRRLELGMVITVQAGGMAHAAFRLGVEQFAGLVERQQRERAERLNFQVR